MHTGLTLVRNLPALSKFWPVARRAAFVALAIAATVAGAAQVSAAGMSTPPVNGQQSGLPGLTLAQVQVETFSGRSNNDRPRPRDRYVCVVPPQQSDDRQRPYVCRANEGRVGGTCRCPNVTGNGRLDLDN
jgi:hypothetical protein